MRRRRFLTSVSAVVVGLGAGCTATGTENPADPGTRTDDTSDTDSLSTSSPSDRERPSVQNHSVETVDTGCMSDDVTGIDASFDETTVTIDGVAQTSNPCFQARIGSASVSDGELQVGIAFDRDEGVCADCVGVVQYEATIELDTTDGIETVTVTHGKTDESQFTETRRGEDAPASPSDGSHSGTTPMDDPGSEPDPDLRVSLDNEHDQRHEIEVEITREGGERVYAETHAIDAESEKAIYNLRDASPDGVETFSITATMDGTTESMQVETSACYGEAIISVTDDGELYPYYSIC